MVTGECHSSREEAQEGHPHCHSTIPTSDPLHSHLFQKPGWDYDSNLSSTPDPLLLGGLVDPTQSPSKLSAAASENPEP